MSEERAVVCYLVEPVASFGTLFRIAPPGREHVRIVKALLHAHYTQNQLESILLS